MDSRTGENPRHGFFRENAFYHPDLRFSLRFPGGWQTQNLPQAVVAAARDGSAAIELTLAPGETAAQAFSGFARQSGLQLGQPVPALGERPSRSWRRIRRQTQSGGIRGIVAFVEQGGRVYRIVGYGAATRYVDYAPAVNATIQSFQTVSDPDVLGVRGNRIAIVQVPRDLHARRVRPAVSVDGSSRAAGCHQPPGRRVGENRTRLFGEARRCVDVMPNAEKPRAQSPEPRGLRCARLRSLHQSGGDGLTDMTRGVLGRVHEQSEHGARETRAADGARLEQARGRGRSS